MSGVYIHIPFCKRKCFYCDFYSVASYASINEFVDLLIEEIDLRSQYHRLNVETIYFGGGTPSTMSAVGTGKILKKIKSSFSVNKTAEITIEANPESVSQDWLQEVRRLGFNRLSLGVQSFNDGELQFLQRLHDSKGGIEAFLSAREAGFDNIGVDIIFSIPGQTERSLLDTLRRVVELNPEHVSAYDLTYESGTPLHEALNKGKISKLEEDKSAKFYEQVYTFLKKADYNHYEVSNFAKPGKESVHNINYWRRKEYYGFGPSASGFINGERYKNYSSIDKYCDSISSGASPEFYREKLTDDEILSEIIMLGCRSFGLDLNAIKRYAGKDAIELVFDLLKSWSERDLIDLAGENDKITSKGYAFADEMAIALAARII